jgi:molecular chaperone DnaK (HSP70)
MFIGIDLGTCNTLCATLSMDGAPVIVPDGIFRDYQHTPSMVIIDGPQILAGGMAEMSEESQPGPPAIRYMKRSFGQGRPLYIDTDGRDWYPETLAALLLKKVRFDAEIQGMQSVKGAVITVPAHYNDAQRKSVLEAAKLADLPLLGLLDEPVAAALHYGNQVNLMDQLVLVYDLGGGTFDLTLLTRSGNTLHVLAKDGISNLGGKEFDELLMDDILQQYKSVFGVVPEMTVPTMQRLSRMAENLKIGSATAGSADWRYQWVSLGGGRMFEYAFSRKSFEQKLETKMAQTTEVLGRCLEGLGITPAMLNKVVLVGGGSKLPLVRKYIENRIPALKDKVEQYEPMQAVAKGAALHAANLGNGTGGLELKSVSTYHIALDNRQSNHTDSKNNLHYDKLILKNSPLPVAARRNIQFVSNGFDRLRLQLVQFWEESGEIFELGSVNAGPFDASAAPLNFELMIENRINGTIGLKLLHNGSDVPIAFQRNNSGKQYLFEHQKKLIESVVVNNVF